MEKFTENIKLLSERLDQASKEVLTLKTESEATIFAHPLMIEIAQTLLPNTQLIFKELSDPQEEECKDSIPFSQRVKSDIQQFEQILENIQQETTAELRVLKQHLSQLESMDHKRNNEILVKNKYTVKAPPQTTSMEIIQKKNIEFVNE